MRKLLVCITMLLIAFMFVSFETAATCAAETTNSEKTSADTSLDLNGKWKVIGEWKNESGSGTFDLNYAIVHKGIEVIMITQSGEKIPCALKGDVLHLEPREAYNPNTGVSSFFPAREYKISQDGNTLTSEFDYTWEYGRMRGPASMKVTMTRE